MSLVYRVSVCVLALSLSLINPAIAQPQSISNSPTSSEVKELATALIRAASEEEQNRLLEEKKESVNPSLLSALKELSRPFVQKGDYKEAARIAELAVRIARIVGDRDGLGDALCDLGAIYIRQRRSAEASDFLQQSLVIFEETGNKKGKARALHAIAINHGNLGRYDLALEIYSKALPLSEEAGDGNLTALILNSLGLAHTTLGRYGLGLEYYEKARALSEQLNDQGTLNMALNNIATHYVSQGRYAEALDYLQRSISIVEEMGADGDRRSLAFKLQNVGTIYRHQGRHDQALVYATRSLKILQEIDDKFGIANLQNNIGVIYKSQGLYDEALNWFDESMRGFKAIPHSGGVARCFNNIGDTNRLRGRPDLAMEPLQESLRLRRANKDRGGISLTLNNLARLYNDQGEYAEMLEVSRESVSIARDINAREELWAAQERVGRALSGMGKPAEARESFIEAISMIEILRHEVAGGGQQQQSFLEDRLGPWLGLIDLLVSQGEYAEALSFAEQSKARVLLDALQGGGASLRESLSQQEREGEEAARFRLVDLNSQLTSELRRETPDPARVAELRASIDRARLEYEDFETKLYVAHPELRLKRGEAPVIKPEELAALVPDANTALLEYVVSDKQTYLFTVTKAEAKAAADIRVYALPIRRDDLGKLVEAFRQQLAHRDLGFRAHASRLNELLLKPAAAQLKGKTNIVIAPDGKLWDLTFQALLTSSNRFLIEDAAIAYAPSLTVLREMTKRRKNRDDKPFSATLLALGNPMLGKQTISRAALTLRDGRLNPLPEAEEEVKELRRLYGISRSKVYVGAEAREDRVKREAGQARIIHFATHGILNNASPMYSHLVLAEGGPNEDGLLEAWELMHLDLKADLAVLSACETARGRIGAGEGMIGLSWAMFIAGVPSLVVSQWKVEATGTRDLMVSFHRALMPGKEANNGTPVKSEALRQAALKLMKNPETRHPFYWAGFVLVGDGR
jgi:CHAT domain-containing protein/Tfp pilus assembly protein PilF